MKGKSFRKYVGIIIMLLSLAGFTLSAAFSQTERASDSEAGKGVTASATGAGTDGQTAARTAFSGIGMGTIAIGTAIEEAAAIAVAASQTTSSKLTTVQ